MICLVTSCSSYKIITILLTVFLMLFIISLWVFYFITRGLWLLIPITSLPPPTPFSPTITCLISVSVSLFLFICFVFQIPYVSEIIGYFVILCWQDFIFFMTEQYSVVGTFLLCLHIQKWVMGLQENKVKSHQLFPISWGLRPPSHLVHDHPCS